MLKWSEPEITEYFGVVSNFDDDAFSHAFQISRDGLVLLVSIFELQHLVDVSLFRDGLPDPLFTVTTPNCSHVHIAQSAGFRACFEAGAPAHPVTNMGIAPVIARGIRVFIEPQFQVELIEPKS
jgi:hypothetical protein